MYSPKPLVYEVEVWPDGSKCWRLNGNLHREDGPAIEPSSDGRGYPGYYLRGVKYPSKEAWGKRFAWTR